MQMNLSASPLRGTSVRARVKSAVARACAGRWRAMTSFVQCAVEHDAEDMDGMVASAVWAVRSAQVKTPACSCADGV
eukprot:3636099-Pleurochrysis_carterae.AAC.2